MGDTPDLDLTSLHFLPAWAKESETPNRYANQEINPSSPNKLKKPFSRNSKSHKPFRVSKPNTDSFRKETPQKPIELPGLKINFIPEEKGLLSLARQIKLTCRAYPIFDIARMILQKPARYHFQLDLTPAPNAISLYTCPLDHSLWLTEEEALKHLLEIQFDSYYRTEKIPIDPPKGNYTGIAVCGFSGTILGPPNYHNYSTQIRKLYKERFSHLPFEKFKNRIRTVTDESTLAKWKEEQSFRSEYHPLQSSATEPLKTRAEAEAHFKTHHFPQLFQKIDSYCLTQLTHQKLSSTLFNYLKNIEQEERRFPIRLVHYLSQELSKHGLKFFKAHKNITYTSIARPQYLDLEQTPVSETIKQIIDFIQNNPKPNRYQLLTAITQKTNPSSATHSSELSPQEISVLRDLHWLIQQGHIIEFANSQLELAKKPKPKTPSTLPEKTESLTPFTAETSVNISKPPSILSENVTETEISPS